MEPKTAQIHGEQFRAKIVPESINEAKRTVDIIWSTGARVLRGYFDQFYEELSMKPKHIRMDRLKSGNTPLLNSHRSGTTTDVLGVVEKASVKKGIGYATVRFSKEEHAASVFRDVVDGILKNISVGYRIFTLEETNETEGELPVRRAIDWEPHELSMVPVGADAGASVRNSAPLNTCTLVGTDSDQEQRDMDEKDKPTITPAVAAPAVVEARAVAPAPVASVPTEAQTAEITAGERKRIAEIRSAGSALKVDAASIEKAIDGGTQADAFRAVYVANLEERTVSPIGDATASPAITPGEDDKDKFARGIQNWLIVRSGLGDQIQRAAKLKGEKIDLDPGEFRGMTLLDVCKASLAKNGQRSSGMLNIELAGSALSHRSGYASVSDFPIILENTMHKMLLAAWGITPDTWRRFCKIGSVSDFRPHNRFRTGTFGTLDQVLPGGEYATKSTPDGRKESIQINTYGNIIAIDRQTIINDDMDAFTSLASDLGRAARLTIEADAYATLALNAGLGPLMGDAKTLFHADHNNIGVGAALAMASLEADRVVMKSQTDENGNDILDLSPSVLLVAAGLAGTAKQLNTAQYDLDDVGGYAPNIVNGMYRDIVDTARMTGTRRYSFADPASAPVLEVAFLNGQQEPFMEMQEGFTIDGTKWKVRMDYEVGGIGYKGAVTNAGV